MNRSSRVKNDDARLSGPEESYSELLEDEDWCCSVASVAP